MRFAVPLLVALALVVLPGSIRAADRLLEDLHLNSGQLPAAEEEAGHANTATLLSNSGSNGPSLRFVALLGRHAVEELHEGIRRIHVPPPKDR